MENDNPSFHHLPAKEIIEWKEGKVSYRLIAGSAFDRNSSLELWSDAFMVEINSTEDQEINLSNKFKGELGILVNKGTILACSEAIEKGNLLVSKDADICKFTIKAHSKVFLIGGSVFPEKRYIDWNFVSSDLEKLEEAKRKWKAGEFPQVPNDSTYVNYPSKPV